MKNLPSYRSGRWVPVMAAPNADFQFTEGHVRILLWMCETHQDWIDTATAEIMRNGEVPSENLMHCREGISDLKCWGLRLMEVIEATPDDEEDEEYDDDESDDDDYEFPELVNFAADLERQWSGNRGPGRRRRGPLSKLRSWLLSILQ